MKPFDLAIDPAKEEKRIIEFIERITKERKYDGVLLLFRNSMNSIVTAQLAAKAVGAGSVQLSVTKEKFQDKDRRRVLNYAQDLLGIPEANIRLFDLGSILEKIEEDHISRTLIAGVPAFSYRLGYTLLRSMDDKFSDLAVEQSGNAKKTFFYKMIATNKIRDRLRVDFAFLTAETENLLVLGSLTKTEWLTGLFTTFGAGHAAHVRPLRELYQTQVYSIARYLGLPGSVREIAESEILPGIQGQYQHFFKLNSADVDRILVRLESKMSIADIINETGLSSEAVERVNHHYIESEYQRMLPLTVKSEIV
ncbi:MAG: hypothetical protein ACFFD4_00355 [Candidatus Odinarchaeota archaeon]